MSQENFEIVERAIAALNGRDIEGYLACCTEGVQLHTTFNYTRHWHLSRGLYEGPDGIRRFFADVVDAGPDFRVTIERLQSVGADRVLGFMRVSASGRGERHPDRQRHSHDQRL